MHALFTLLLASSIWIDENGAPRPEVHRMLSAIESTEDDALQPEDYHRTELALSLRNPHSDAGMLEVLLTDAYVKLYAHQHGGRVDPSSMRPRVVSAEERAL